MNDKKDLSHTCDMNDDNMENDCWHCVYFLFPIGCMYGEERNEEDKNDYL